MRYLLYKDYESGFANDVLSIELGVGLSALTGRTLVVYGSADAEGRLHPLRGGHFWEVPASRRHLIDNNRRPTILDLLEELPVPTLGVAHFRELQRDGVLTQHDSELHLPGAAFIGDASVPAARIADFAAGRPIFGDRPEDVWHLSRRNLGYYSRSIFPLSESTLRTLAGVRLREPYRHLADRVAASIGRFNGAHIRLTDFRQFLPHQVADYPAAVLQTLRELFDPQALLVISTDEPLNAEFFAGIVAAFPRTVFLDAWIVEHFADEFRTLAFTDETAFGVICNLVMRHADGFAGTPGSTFSGLIHRAWGQRMLARGLPFAALDFRYISSGGAAGDLPFERGSYLARQRGRFSWNRIGLPRPTEMQSWYREWPEACLPSAALPETLGPTTASAHAAPTRVTVRPMDLSWLPAAAPQAAVRPAPLRSEAAASDEEIVALLPPAAWPELREAEQAVPPLALSQEVTGRSHWVRWALAGLLVAQLAMMWWPRG